MSDSVKRHLRGCHLSVSNLKFDFISDGGCTREEQIALSLKRHLFPHGGREPKAFWICFSRVRPPSEIKSNFKFKTLKRHLLKRHLTLSGVIVVQFEHNPGDAANCGLLVCVCVCVCVCFFPCFAGISAIFWGLEARIHHLSLSSLKTALSKLPKHHVFQGKTKGQQLKGKIVSEFFSLFLTFSEFFPQGLPLQNSSTRTEEKKR